MPAPLENDTPDIALLDVNLGREETSFSVAIKLHEMGVPIVFLSGYSPSVVDVPEN